MEELEEQRSKLSNDVMIDILKRMTATSLLRLKCVSKIWYSLISSPSFLYIHYNYDSISNHIILFKRYRPIDESAECYTRKNMLCYKEYCYSGRNILSFHSNDESFKCIAPNIEYSDNYIGVNIVGPCNGIVCIASYRTIMLYNPTLNEFLELPPSSIPLSRQLTDDEGKFNFWMHITMGIGFDSNTNVYKVIRILNIEHTDGHEEDYVFASKVEVYNLSTNCWRKIEDLECVVKSFDFSPVLFNGAFHWDGFMEIKYRCIISFNFSSESFHKIPYPEVLCDENTKDTSVFVLNKTLAMICFTKNQENHVHQSIDIWVMKIYSMRESWINEFKVGPLLIYAPLAIWLNDTELMIESYNGKLMSCNLYSQDTKDLDMSGLLDSLKIVVCKERLISIKREREIWC